VRKSDFLGLSSPGVHRRLQLVETLLDWLGRVGRLTTLRPVGLLANAVLAAYRDGTTNTEALKAAGLAVMQGPQALAIFYRNARAGSTLCRQVRGSAAAAVNMRAWTCCLFL
jgi:hypothetical protein